MLYALVQVAEELQLLNLGAAIGMRAQGFWRRVHQDYSDGMVSRRQIVTAMLKCAVEAALRCMERHSVGVL